jgi:DNA-binding response OmpR family regulator
VTDKKPTLLIIESHLETRKFLEAMLSKNYEVATFSGSIDGIENARKLLPDLIILEAHLPILNGFDTSSLLKKDERTKNTPILLLSLKPSPQEMNRALEMGIDDYIPKPFDYKELEAKVESRIHRKNKSRIVDKLLILGEVQMNIETREVIVSGEKKKLTLTEFDILKLLIERQAQIVSRNDIIETIWKDEKEAANARTIDVHIRSLRKKIPLLSKHIISIYGVGYKYEA